MLFNGEPVEIPLGITLATFLASQDLHRKSLILELNEQVIPPEADISGIELHDADVLNAFRVVSGG